MNSKILNPFIFIAGLTSLFAGIVVLTATAVTGYFSKTHFPDIISVKIGADFSIWYYIIQSFSNWIVLSLILYLAAIIYSKSSVRAIDIFGTQAIARFPYLLAAFTGFSDSIDKLGKYFMWNYLQIGAPVNLSALTVITAIVLLIFTAVLTIWLVILMYNAFKVSSNIKGTNSIVLFIIVFIIIISHYLILKFS
jgi:hypothetical protein